MQDLCHGDDRAQALALLRTAGDVGLLCGSIFSGVVSEVIGMSSTMGANAGFLAAAMAWYVLYCLSVVLFIALPSLLFLIAVVSLFCFLPVYYCLSTCILWTPHGTSLTIVFSSINHQSTKNSHYL
jgi:hypothetical protein